MMSLRAVHAGTGYQYLLRSVATHDGPKEPGQSLSDYYAAKGTPAGRWIGSGLSGLSSEAVVSGRVVSEEQMAALYGEGLHPDADELMRNGVSLADVKLGRAFPMYTGGKPVLVALATAEKQFRLETGRRPDESERGQLAESVGRSFYLADGGFAHASGADVIAWVNRQRDEVRQAVAGFDWTFSPVKSVSVLWALADEDTASRIAALHHEAVAEAIAWAESNVIYTRQGTNGIEQVTTGGVIASEFTHFDTRGGDPDLHSHVLIANKVQAPDGSWKALDSKTIHQMHQTVSARYDTALHDRLTRELGVEFTPRSPSPEKAPVWDIAGVDSRLIETFSSRRALARPVYDRLVADYVTTHGFQPTQRAGYALWQKAILDTRDAKKPAHSLAEHRRNWRAQASAVVGDDAVDTLWQAVTHTDTHRAWFDSEEHAGEVAAEAIRAVTGRRSEFLTSHVDTAVSTVLKGYRFTTTDHRHHAHQAVMTIARREHMVSLTPAEPFDLPAALSTTTGAGIDVRANSQRFTTHVVLAAEDTVLSAGREPVAVFAPTTALETALTTHAQTRGWSLNHGQKQLAHHLLTCGTLVAAGVGPAGTGKTAAMKIVADTWRHQDRAVIGLAPSAAAASVLSSEIDSHAVTIDSLTYTWRGLHPTAPGHTLESLPVQINPGDLLLVDEAGMASTENLAALTDIAHTSGAIVRLIGDPHQLGSVTSGSVFTALTRTTDAPELREVMRHGADRAQGEATLGVRDGDPGALELYDRRGWIRGGTREAMLTDAVDAYLTDVQAGRSSLVIAARNTDVDAMNEIIRSHQITTGVVDTRTETRVARGDTIGIGDTVIARKNQIFAGGGRVINGQLFTLTDIHDDGSLAVIDKTTRKQTLIPADYAVANVHLGYASTIHRAQGATVDTSHTVVDTSLDRAGLYVSLTRGKKENRAYAVCEPVLDTGAEDAHLHSAGDRHAPSAREVLDTVLRRDTRQRSAIEAIHDELTRVSSPHRLHALYRHGLDIATGAFTAETLPDYLDALPRVFARDLGPGTDGYSQIAAAWTHASLTGTDPRTLWHTATTGLENVDDPAAVIAWRLRHHTDQEPGEYPSPPPLTPGADTELHTWLSDHAARSAESASGEEAEVVAARERMATSRLATRTDERLEDRYARVGEQISEVSRRHDELEQRLHAVHQTGVHTVRVREQHARLDTQVAAITEAEAVYQRLHHARHTVRTLEARRSLTSQELAGLKPWAVRRRRDAEQRLDRLDTQQRQWEQQIPRWQHTISELTDTAGPETHWARLHAQAADIRRRDQELHEAAGQDRRDAAQLASAVEKSGHELDQAHRRRGEIGEELQRRRGLTDTQQTVEHTLREQHREEREARILDSVRARRTTSTPGTRQGPRPSARRSPSTRPDTGPTPDF